MAPVCHRQYHFHLGSELPVKKRKKLSFFYFFIRSRSETSQAWFAYTRVQYSQCSKAESETKAFSASPAAGLTGPGLGCQKNPDC